MDCLASRAILNLSPSKLTDMTVKNKKSPVIVSIFCGRIADCGIDPEPIIVEAKKIFKEKKLRDTEAYGKFPLGV